jgi:class 3 adenylate cyclase
MDQAVAKNSSEKRVLVSVMFAEIRNLSALADILDLDQVGDIINSLWKDFSKIIHEYGGVIDKQLGDNLLIIWGAPESQEDDAERAVVAGLELQEALKEFKNQVQHPAAKALSLTLGLHTGLVLAGKIGVGGILTILGENLNLAKRLQEFGDPGSLIISEATYQAIRGAFQVKSLPPVQLEGTKQLISLYQILEELPQPTKLRYRSKGGLETNFVGRDDELSRLEDIYEEVRSEQKTKLVLVTGDTGVGKSRLLYEFVGILETQNPHLTVMSSRALDQTSRVPYYLWKELWSNRFELSENDPDDEACKKTIDGVLTLWGKALGEVTAVEAAHFLGSLIGVEWKNSRYLSQYTNNAITRTQRAFGLVEEILYRASHQGPVVLILDDLHWADAGSLELIRYLWKLADKKIPLLILSCAWSEFLNQQTPKFDEADIIHLAPLPISVELVQQAYPALKDAPKNLLKALAIRSQGNPYFLEELVKNVLSSENRDLGDPDLIEKLPDSLEGLLKTRLDSLSLEGRATAYFAAVAGRVFWKGSILAAFRKSPGITNALKVSSQNLVGKIQQALDELMEKELAFLRVGSAFSGDREYIFKHSLLREAAYQRLPDEYRLGCHLAVADWLAERIGSERSITVAKHYEKAEAYQQALDFYTKAAEHARLIGNESEADEIQYHARTLPADIIKE